MKYHLLLLLLLFPEGSCNVCRVEQCTEWFSRTKDYEGLSDQPSQRYCSVISIFLKCMSDTARHCRGNIRFHSSELVIRRQYELYNCSQYKEEEVEERCNFLPSSTKHFKYCSLFGDPHLLRFDGTLETCSEEGARPLVDNRYFLIQVTNSNVRGEPLTTTVSKVTVIVRKHNCTEPARYEALSEEESLPSCFTDGTTFQKKFSDSNAVEIVRQSKDYVQISFHHIHTSIHIRRQGPYLAVSVKAPKQVLETGTTEANELCWAGCQKRSRLDHEAALANPYGFSKCYARRIVVPVKVAVDRCNDIGLTDGFLDACVFDLMLTGDDYLVSLSRLAQQDYKKFSSHRHQHLLSGRTNLRDDLQQRRLDGCISAGSSATVFWLILTVLIDL